MTFIMCKKLAYTHTDMIEATGVSLVHSKPFPSPLELLDMYVFYETYCMHRPATKRRRPDTIY